MNLKNKIKDVKDFPIKGIDFKDISPLLEDKKYFFYIIDELENSFNYDKIDKIIGIESRGFLFSAPLAYKLNKGHVMMRKLGKLPGEKYVVNHTLEYGTGTLELQKTSIIKGERVLIVDDVLATGGTVGAAIKLVEMAGGIIEGIAFVIKLKQFEVFEIVNKYNNKSLIEL